MPEKNTLSTNPAAHELTLTRILDAPCRLVFNVWTESKHLAEWWGPEGFTNPVCDLDLVLGGEIYIEMKGPDGTVYPMSGMFTEIIVPERLGFTCSALDANNNPLFEVLTVVSFTEQGGKTKLTMHAIVTKTTAEAAPYIAGMNEGWNQSLNRLANYVANQNRK